MDNVDRYSARSSNTAVPWPRTLSKVKIEPTSAGSLGDDVMTKHMWSLVWPGVCKAWIRKPSGVENVSSGSMSSRVEGSKRA